MIFNCPSCQAGHSVPVSMIPNGGMELSCRRCGTAFAVDLPVGEGDDPGAPNPLEATDEMASPLPEKEPEATTVGIDNPFDELSRSGQAPLMAPSGSLVPEAVEPLEPVDPPEAATQGLLADRLPTGLGSEEPSTGTIPQTDVPLGPDETGVDPELDNTQRVDVDDDAPLGAPTVATQSPILEERPESSSADLYERVERGQYIPEEPRPEAPRPPSPKAWNEPSGSMAALRPKGPLRSLADAINTAPLPLKVGLSVFPVALGLTLMLTASSDAPRADRVEIAVAAPPSAPPTVRPESGTPAPAPAARPERSAFVDEAAPSGYAYVQVDDARIRAKAQAKSAVTAKLPVGTLVRLHPGTDEWALVVVEPEGPAGFLPKQLLGSDQPIAKLAADMAFSGCVVEPGATVDTCLYEAKESQEACAAGCGAVGRAPVRCVEACGAAFDRCSRGCFESAKPEKRKRRR